MLVKMLEVRLEGRQVVVSWLPSASSRSSEQERMSGETETIYVHSAECNFIAS